MPPKRKQNGKATGVGKKRSKLPAVKRTVAAGSKKTELEKGEATYQTFQDVVTETRKNQYKITCKQCSKHFKFKNSYRDHMEYEHSTVPGSVQCKQCPVRCPTRHILRGHIAEKHERELHECPHCKKTFVRAYHVERHLAQKGCGGLLIYSFPCEICGVEFTRKDNLMVHLRQQHIMKKKFTCKHCDHSTSSFSRLVVHYQSNHSETPPKYECHDCGSITSSRAAIIKHMEIHGDKKFSCDVCGYRTFTVEVMKRHVMTHVKDKPYKCDECGASFIQRVQLTRHSEHHTGCKICAKCDERFPNEAEYFIHVQKKHRKTQHLSCPYKCSLETSFEDDEALEAHIKLHAAMNTFRCDVCNKTFKTEGGLRRHVTVHALERARRCMYCVTARAYVRGTQLVRHVRRAHPAIFRDHLHHVRRVLGVELSVERVKQSELDAILSFLDSESERILENYGEGVLYGGMQEVDPATAEDKELDTFKSETSPLMSEAELEARLRELLVKLIDMEKLECFGWPHEPIDTVLEKVVESCGGRVAERDKWTRVQRLRENTKQLFLYVIENKNVARMLDTNTIDQIVAQLLAKVEHAD